MDSTDPALSQDQLPQPYRMITKVIEEYILDPVWLEITRLHPELLQDEDGEAFCTPHNQALQHICTPSSVMEQEFTFTSVLEREGLLFMSTDNDAFVVVDPASGTIVQSIRLDKEELPKTAEEIEAEATAAAAAADPKAKKGKAPEPDASPPALKKISNMWISDASLPVTDERLMNFSIVSVVESEEEPPADPAVKKGKGAAPVEMTKVPKCRVIVVQVVLGVVEGFKSSLISLDIVGEAFSPLEDAQVGSVGRVDVSPNGRLLCMSTSVESNIFSLPVKVKVSRTKIGNVEQIVEDDMNVKEETEGDLKKDEEDDQPGEEGKPQLEPILTLGLDSFFEGKKVRGLHFFPLYKAEQVPKQEPDARGGPRGEDEATGEEAVTPNVEGLERYYHTAMAVIFEKSPEWVIVSMSGLVDLHDEVKCDGVSATQLFRWSLPASASAFALDDDRSALVIGTREGTLCMWNLTTRGLTSIVGRHETAVSCISFLQCSRDGGMQPDYFVVSGAEDGTLCMFHLSVPLNRPGITRTTTELFAQGETDSAMGDGACLSSKFISFRKDVNAGTSIVCVRTIRGMPWALVSCSDGMCMVYDVPNALLLGRLALYSGMTSRQVDWKIVNFAEIILDVKTGSIPKTEKDGVEDEGGKPGPDDLPAVPEKEMKDPNAFLRQPPAKRALKYAVAESFEWGKPVLSNVVAAPSKTSFHCLYKRNDLPVLATFRAEDVIVNFYSEFASSFKAESKNSFLGVDMLTSFKRISSEERANPELAREKLQALSRTFLGTDRPRSGENSSKGGGGSSRRSGTGQGGRKSQGSVRPGSFRKGSATSVESPRITKTNLDALQDALGTDVGAAKDPASASILHSSYNRIMDPGDTARAAARSSKVERASRKNRLLNRLGNIGASLG